jgi:hypothetical protein
MMLTRSILSQTRIAAAALLAAASLSLLAGCKGNTTSAANLNRTVGAPPTVAARLATGDVQSADPLSSDLWRNATWMTLTAPANTARTTATSRAAILFDAANLYVAFVNVKQPTLDTSLRDAVSLYLDTTAAGDGREMIKVSVDAQGQPSCTWVRMASPPEQRPDGSPDLAHPVSTLPNQKIVGLWAKVGEGTMDGVPAWTAVVAIPLRNLPTPLRTTATAGAHWKFNLLRNVVSGLGTARAEQLQANLSPVYVGAQEFAPYRMAELVLVN